MHLVLKQPLHNHVLPAYVSKFNNFQCLHTVAFFLAVLSFVYTSQATDHGPELIKYPLIVLCKLKIHRTRNPSINLSASLFPLSIQKSSMCPPVNGDSLKKTEIDYSYKREEVSSFWYS